MFFLGLSEITSGGGGMWGAIGGIGWLMLALISYWGFYRLHPLRPALDASSNALRRAAWPWLLVGGIGFLHLLARGLALGELPRSTPFGNWPGGAFETAFGRLAEAFHLPAEIWPLSILLALFPLIGSRLVRYEILIGLEEERPWLRPLLVVLLVGALLGHLLARASDLVPPLLPAGMMGKLAAQGSRLFELELMLLLQAYLFLWFARLFDRKPEALGSAPLVLAARRIWRLLPLALILLGLEALPAMLENFAPLTADFLSRWFRPLLLLALAPLTYLLVFAEGSPGLGRAAGIALALLPRAAQALFWLITFFLPLLLALTYLDGRFAPMLGRFSGGGWALFSPFLAAALGTWLVATWFIVLQKSGLPVIKGLRLGR